MSTLEAVNCVLCNTPAQRWKDNAPGMRYLGSFVYDCSACGGRFAVTGSAHHYIQTGKWDLAALRARVQGFIAQRRQARIDEVGGLSDVQPYGQQ